MAKKISKSELGIDGNIFSDLTKSMQENKAVSESLKIVHNALKDQLKETSKQAGNLRKELDQANTNTVSGLKEYTVKQKEANQLLLDAEKIKQAELRTLKAIEQAKQSELRTAKMVNSESAKTLTAYQKESKALNEMRNRYKDLAVQKANGIKLTKDERKEMHNLISEIQKSDTNLKNIDNTVGQNQRNVGNYTKAVGGLKNGLAQLGLAFGVFELGKSFFNLATNIDDTTNKARMFFGLGETGSKAIAKEATIMANVWGKDVNEIMITANALAKEFGLSGEEALAKIEKGFNKGADVSGEFLSNIKEYSSQLTVAGLTADESIALITQSQEKGVFSDKGVDAIKEATLSLREMTQPTQDALKAIGMSGEEVLRQISSGEKTYYDVIREISSKTKEIGQGSQEAGMILADVFKGAGEDAGAFIFELGDMDLSLDKMEDTSLGVNSAIGDLKRAFLDYVIGVNEAGGVTEKIAGFFNFLAKNIGTIISLVTKLGAVFLIYKTRLIAINVAQKIFEKGTALLNVPLKETIKNLKEGAKNGTGMGSALKSIGWSGLIALGSALAFELYKIASGASQAEEDLYRLNKTSEDALESVSKNIDQIKGNLSEELVILERQYKIDLSKAKSELEKSKIQKKYLEDLKAETKIANEQLINNKKLVVVRKEGYLENLKALKALKIVNSQAFASAGDETKAIKAFKEAGITDFRDFAGAISVDKLKDAIAEFTAKIAASDIKIKEYKASIKEMGNNLSDAETEVEVLNNDTRTNTTVTQENTKAHEEKIEVIKDLREQYELLDKERENLFENIDLEEAFNLEYVRAINVAEIARIEKEIEISKAKQNGASAESIALLEKELIELRKKEILANRDLDVRNAGSPAERMKIEKQAELDIANLYNKDIVETEKKNYEERNKYIELATEFLEKQIDRRIEALDREIEAQQRQQDILQELANNGNINAQQSLAVSAELERQAQAEKLKQEQRKQQLQIVSSFLTSYNMKLEEGKSGGEAFSEALAERAVLEAFLSSLPAFYEGTEDTGRVSNPLDANGGRVAILHDNERVMTKAQNEKLQGLTNDQIVSIVTANQMSAPISAMSLGWESVAVLSELNGLKSEMKSVRKAIEDKPETNYNVEGVVNGVLSLTKATKQGNSITYNRFKIK